VPADDHNVRTGVGDRVGEGTAEASVGTGDEGGAALQAERVFIGSPR